VLVVSTIRFAEKNDLERQKEIWRLCFGDSGQDMEIYYTQRYKAQQTLLLLHRDEIAAMTTLLPVSLVTADGHKAKAVMVFAVATDPQYRGQGFASELMGFCDQYLNENDIGFSVLVPAEKSLFGFYERYAYHEMFFMRRIRLDSKEIAELPGSGTEDFKLYPITAEEYNRRRNRQLEGRLHIAYSDEDLAYQKALSNMSGADLYGVEHGTVQGCAVVERIGDRDIVIKELLLPAAQLNGGLQIIAQQLKADVYRLRLPAFEGEPLGGSVETFGMLRVHNEKEREIRAEDLGYLGIAFD